MGNKFSEFHDMCFFKNINGCLDFINKHNIKCGDIVEYDNCNGHSIETYLTFVCKYNSPTLALKLMEGVEIINDDYNNEEIDYFMYTLKNRKETSVHEKSILLDKEEYKKLFDINKKFNLNYKSSNEGTALLYACQNVSSEKYNIMNDVAIKLIKSGNLNYGQLWNYITLLMYACIKGAEQVALELIKTGKSNPGYSHNNEPNALVLACKSGLIKVSHELLKIDEFTANTVLNNNISTALIYACKNNMTTVIFEIIKIINLKEYPVNIEHICDSLIHVCENRMIDVIIDIIVEIFKINNSKMNSKINNSRYTMIVFNEINKMDDEIKKKMLEDKTNICDDVLIYAIKKKGYLNYLASRMK